MDSNRRDTLHMQPGSQAAMYNPHGHPGHGPGEQQQNHIHPNGAHRTSVQHSYLPPGGNGQLNGNGQYAQNGFGLGQPQHPQYYPGNQLAPMHANGGTFRPMPPVPGPASLMPPLGPQIPTTAAHQLTYQAQGGQVQQPPVGSVSAAQEGVPRPELKPYSGDNGKYKFELKIEQQPQRARMCGFGDKDRRPITPPPCIRLLITDIKTGKAVKPDDIDGTFFVLQVDLWDDTGTREVNLVRSSSSSPAVSISTATTTSYPPTNPDRTPSHDYTAAGYYQIHEHAQLYNNGQGYAVAQGPRASLSAPVLPGPLYAASHPPQSPFGNVPAGYFLAPGPPPVQPSQNMYTRNLIGSLTVNASLLKDLNEEHGYWFVLQDLSVRTEGQFRLKMNFIDVSAPDGSGLNKAKAPVLAYTYSESFQVYSAKKFPGVIESTALSKCFAQQGIKIPIRKEVKGGEDGEED